MQDNQPGGAPNLDFVPFGQAREDVLSNGFAAIPAFTTPEDVANIRALIAPLFDAPDERLKDQFRNLADGAPTSSRIVELTNLVEIEPRLAETLFFRRALAFTTRVFGPGVRFRFDHAIDKSAHNDQPTKWHQDCAYSGRVTLSARKLHWWLPLQPVDLENGCMQFVRGSHAGRVLPHQRQGRTGHARAVAQPAFEAVACPLALGGVTVHMPKTLHYTGPNNSDDRRLAWIVHMGVRGWPPRIL